MSERSRPAPQWLLGAFDAIEEAKETAAYASTGATWEEDFVTALAARGYMVVPMPDESAQEPRP